MRIGTHDVKIRDPDVDKELHDVEHNGEDPGENSPASTQQDRASAEVLEVRHGVFEGMNPSYSAPPWDEGVSLGELHGMRAKGKTFLYSLRFCTCVRVLTVKFGSLFLVLSPADRETLLCD